MADMQENHSDKPRKLGCGWRLTLAGAVAGSVALALLPFSTFFPDALMPFLPIVYLALFLFVFVGVSRRLARDTPFKPSTASNLTPCLVVDGLRQAPGLVGYVDGQIELLPLFAEKITVAPEEIEAVRETKWFNGKLLLGKTGFWLTIPGRARLGFAVPNAVAPVWRSRLSIAPSNALD